MNIQHKPSSGSGSLDASGEEAARGYYKRRLKRSQDRANLPRYVGPEYTSVIRTIERFSLVTHLIFLFKRKKISKSEYMEFITVGNAAILEGLRRKRLLSDLDMY